jgi:hypothetical protein
VAMAEWRALAWAYGSGWRVRAYFGEDQHALAGAQPRTKNRRRERTYGGCDHIAWPDEERALAHSTARLARTHTCKTERPTFPDLVCVEAVGGVMVSIGIGGRGK